VREPLILEELEEGGGGSPVGVFVGCKKIAKGSSLTATAGCLCGCGGNGGGLIVWLRGAASSKGLGPGAVGLGLGGAEPDKRGLKSPTNG
jgi:hypothetical protein